MNNFFIFDPKTDEMGSFRGGGRIMQILRENLPEAQFIADLSSVALAKDDSTLLIPSWNPFTPPVLEKRIAERQFLMIFDVIPLKYPKQFPAGVWGKINLWRNHRALSVYDGFITISKEAKKDIIEYLALPEDKVHVVYPTTSKIFWNAHRHSGEEQSDDSRISNKIDSGQARLADALAKRARVTTHDNSQISNLKFQIPEHFALYVGDVNWNKNLVNLARAIKIADVNGVFVGRPFENINNNRRVARPEGVPQNAQSIEHIVGRGRGRPRINLPHPWQREFKAFIEEVGEDKRFIFLGYVEDDELIKLYQQATGNVLVSRDEGFGMSFLEAGTQGCPSVLSDIPVFKEIASESARRAEPSPLGGALFADPESPESIASELKKLFNTKKLRNDLGKKAHSRASKLFSPEVFRKNFLQLTSNNLQDTDLSTSSRS